MTAISIVLGTIAVFSTVKWLKWRMVSLSLIYYITKSGYALPTKKDMEERTRFVINNTLKDVKSPGRKI